MNKGDISNWREGQERRFIAWALARDDDWWEEGNGHISIWDFRIMQDFFDEELQLQREQIRGYLKEQYDEAKDSGAVPKEAQFLILQLMKGIDTLEKK